MEVFTLSRGWKIAIYIMLAILLFVFGFIAIGVFIDPSMKRAIVFLLPMSLIAIFFIVCGFLQVDEKVMMDDYSIRKVSRLINREILLGDIKGYKLDQSYLYVYPYKGRGKRILISTYVQGITKLRGRLEARYPDLNARDMEEIVEEVVEQTGGKDFSRNIKRAKTEVYTLTGITVGMCVLCYCYYGWSQIALFCCVPLSLLLLLRHKGLVQVDSSKDSPLPSIFMIPLLVLLMQFMQNSNIHLVSYGRLWQLSLCVTAALIVLLWLCSKHLNRKKSTFIVGAILLSLAFVGHGYGLILSVNCIMDKKGAYEYYESVVTDKSISKGKTTSYYLTVQPWAHQPVSERESVSRDVYDEVQINGKVGIYYFKGVFNIPWYVLDKTE